VPDLDPNLQKEAVKEALKEWLNEQFASFGKWTFTGLIASAFAGMVYLCLLYTSDAADDHLAV
jgi:hypothetical protein